MDKITVVYIGPKPFKKDTLTGSRLMFPKGQPVATPSDVAWRLLAHPAVWIRAEDYPDWQSNRAEYEARLQEDEDARQRLEAEAQLKMDMTCGEYGDIGRLTAAQLRTLVEGAELVLDPQGAQEKVDAFRLRVRDALRARLAGGE